MIHLISEVLELLPCETLVESDGDAALNLLHQQLENETPVDAVLLDIMMPGEDGFHVLGKMKSDPELQQIPVILITGLNSIVAKTRGLEMGAEDYIIKPFDASTMKKRIEAVIGALS